MRVTHRVVGQTESRKHKVMAAGDDDFDTFDDFDDLDDLVEDDQDDVTDSIDDLADTVEDIQDAVDEVEEDDVEIDIDNNIEDHYIAECDRCHGVFISATVESDQQIDKVTGICPLCNKESDQFLKWVIKRVED